MAIIKTIPWDDGSGDNIYLDSNASEGNQTVTVSSDANTGDARTQIITFFVDGITQSLTVNQDAGGPQQYTITKYPSSYDTTDYSYTSISNPSRAYMTYDSATYCLITMETGSRAASYVYFQFDVSSIPANATIDSVSCTTKTYVSSGTANIPIANVCMYSGTTAMGSSISVTGTSANVKTMSDGTWTRSDLDNIRVRFYAQRGTGNTSTKFYMRFYGATLTIKYTV